MPLIDELVAVLRRVVGERRVGPVFLRPKFLPEKSGLGNADFRRMIIESERRIVAAENNLQKSLTRAQIARIHRSVWKDAGAVSVDAVRTSFCRIARRCGIYETCPKSWRHTMATLLQDANVDLLIRQITLGHAPAAAQLACWGQRRSTHTPARKRITGK